MRRPTFFVLVCLVGSGCPADAKNAGIVESTDGSTGAATETDADTDSASPSTDIDWTVDLEGASRLMLGTADGVIVVESVEGARVTEYAADMSVLWSVDIPDAEVLDINPLGDGYVLGGCTSTEVAPSHCLATAWRLSCCGAIEQTEFFPPDVAEDSTRIVVAEPHAGGLLLVRGYDDDTATHFIRTDLDLVQEWVVAEDILVRDGALTPAGDIVVFGTHYAGTLNVEWVLRELSADGSGSDVIPVAQPLLVGSGADLMVLRNTGLGQVTMEPYGGGVAIEIDHEFGFLGFFHDIWDRHDRFVFASGIIVPLTPNKSANITNVVEFDAAGTVVREVPIPGVTPAVTNPGAIAVGHDNAIYVAYVEMTVDGGPPETASRLVRIAPL
jgi:hypothetical protein